MIPIKTAFANVMKLASKNSSTILTVVAATGVGATVYATFKATPKATKILEIKREAIENLESDLKAEVITEEVYKSTRRSIYIQFAKDMSKALLPVIGAAGITITAIIGSHTIDKRRQAALAAALTITEDKLKDYQDKVKETIGERKEQKVRDAIAGDKVAGNPPVEKEIISTGKGDVLCYDAMSGRYFTCNADYIRSRVNVLNQRLLSEMWMSLNDLYYELNLPTIKIGDDIGWNINNDGLIEVCFSSQLTEDDKPVLVLDYDVEPRFDYRTLR